MNKLIPTILTLGFSIFSASAQINKYRAVWLFSPDAGNASFIKQKSNLNDAAGLRERDIAVHEVVGTEGNKKQFARYHADKNSFTFILIGKDGGEKMRSKQTVSREKLYRTIDAMPMRQSEMKKQK